MKSTFLLVSSCILILSTSAFANTVQYRVPNDAHDLKVISAGAGQVVTGGTCVSSDSLEGYPCEMQYTYGAGLNVTVSFTAKNAFPQSNEEGTPLFTDSGTNVYGVVAASQLLGATFVDKQVQKNEVDYDHSSFCAGSLEGNGSFQDPNCVQHIVYKTVTVTERFLSLSVQ